ncbi:MAG: calcium/sodium antiporter [Ruminococcaceae bacterium]|nr:calcium/sodium antiporter [Oscillospiraceae bacterium]
MEILLQVLLLALGFVLLVKGADWFVDGSASIAAKFGIPQLIIGLTVVAMGTSAPEAAVSISAAFANNADITIGNVVGSNIMNILIILGLSSVITVLKVAKSTVWIDIPIMVGGTILLLLLGLDGIIGRLDAAIIFACFVTFIIYMIISAKKSNEQGDNIKVMSIPMSLLFAILGLAMIIAGSQFTVNSATFLAAKAGVSERFIGLTVVALGTSLPELFTSVMAARKGNADIAIGNIVGSNIFNILFIVGLSGLIIPINFQPQFVFDTLVALAAAVLLFLLCFRKKQLGKIAGIIMLIGYAAYFACIV